MSEDTDLSDCVEELANETLTRRRTSAEQTVNSEGLVVPGGTTDLRFRAMVTPATGRDLERLPEGQRGPNTVKIITTTELRIALSDPSEATSRRRGDIVVRESGSTFEVANVQHWDGHGNFYDVLAQEVRR